MQTYKYLLLIVIIGIIGLGVYRICIGHPDYTLFILPLILMGFYMRQRGLARLKEVTDNETKPEQ